LSDPSSLTPQPAIKREKSQPHNTTLTTECLSLHSAKSRQCCMGTWGAAICLSTATRALAPPYTNARAHRRPRLKAPHAHKAEHTCASAHARTRSDAAPCLRHACDDPKAHRLATALAGAAGQARGVLSSAGIWRVLAISRDLTRPHATSRDLTRPHARTGQGVSARRQARSRARLPRSSLRAPPPAGAPSVRGAARRRS